MTTFHAHDLGEGHRFLEGKLPDELVPDDDAFAALWEIHPTTKHQIWMVGRIVETPRWQQAYGRDYVYTGNVNEALPVPPILVPLLAWVRANVDARLNGILLNWYEGPGHYIGPHHDSIVGLVEGTPIVTVSFGETRVFRLSRGKGQTRNFPAPHGTVFVLGYATNLVWKHSVPKSVRYTGRRISVTFRAFADEL